MDGEDVFRIYNQERSKILYKCEIFRNKDVSLEDIEKIIDDLPLNTLKSKRFLRGFNDDKHIKNFLYHYAKRCVRTQCKQAYIQNLPELTQKERIENFNLARDIINNNR